MQSQTHADNVIFGRRETLVQGRELRVGAGNVLPWVCVSKHRIYANEGGSRHDDGNVQ